MGEERWDGWIRRTTQLIFEVEESVRSKKAPRQVETFVVASRPNGPRLKSAEDMLYACVRVVSALPCLLKADRLTIPPKVIVTLTTDAHGYE